MPYLPPADGVEPQIQHLYAYACARLCPIEATRFQKEVTRGCAPVGLIWEENGLIRGYDRNKYPGENGFEEAFANQDTYGHSIIKHYYAQIFSWQTNDSQLENKTEVKIKADAIDCIRLLQFTISGYFGLGSLGCFGPGAERGLPTGRTVEAIVVFNTSC